MSIMRIYHYPEPILKVTAKKVTTVARDIFRRLRAGRLPAAEESAKQPRKNTDRVSRWKRKTDADIFLKRVLTNGPMPTAVIEELGAARRFSKRQLECAKQRIGATAFKKKGKLRGCWFWTLEPGATRKPIFATSRKSWVTGYNQSTNALARAGARRRECQQFY